MELHLSEVGLLFKFSKAYSPRPPKEIVAHCHHSPATWHGCYCFFVVVLVLAVLLLVLVVAALMLLFLLSRYHIIVADAAALFSPGMAVLLQSLMLPH